MIFTQTPLDSHAAKQLNPVVLAFVGDAVYSLYIREKLSVGTSFKTGELQRRTAAVVSAQGQNATLDKIRPHFTAEEEEIFLRGRNAKKGTKSKAATVAEYNRSTGFEAVIGFLHLTGNDDRIIKLLAFAEEGARNANTEDGINGVN